MKFGVSTYSLKQAIQSGEMTVLEVIDWISAQGGEHVEIVPRGFDLEETPELIEQIRKKANETGLVISNYCISSNFITADESAYRQQIAHVLKHVDIARGLGAYHIRHDVASRPVHEATLTQFEADLNLLVQACREIADYAAQWGIATSVENHGRYIQKSDRVQRLVTEVNRANFKTLLDVGNFLVVDENPVVAVKNNIPFASTIIHLKDFYYRPSKRYPSELWKHTAGGNYYLGAIIGHGDVDLYEIMKIIKASGFDGYFSIEFEGLEECTLGTRIGLENARRIWDEV